MLVFHSADLVCSYASAAPMTVSHACYRVSECVCRARLAGTYLSGDLLELRCGER